MEDLKSDYETLSKLIPRIDKKYTFELFHRAKILFTSRSFNLDEELIGLVPIFDMINTAPTDQINAQWVLVDDEYFILTAKHFIEKDEEITISYGEKDNYLQFLAHGFLFENAETNPFNFYPF